jgi:hypothetical protein
LFISQLENIIQIVLTTATSDDEAREKAKSIEGMQISVFLLDLWCTHFVEVWRDSNIEDLAISITDKVTCLNLYDLIGIFFLSKFIDSNKKNEYIYIF